jgi:hypothetical protein
MKTVTINIPEKLYGSLMDLFFAALRKSDISEKSPELYAWVQSTVHAAFKNGDILVVDNKIVNKKDLGK